MRLPQRGLGAVMIAARCLGLPGILSRLGASQGRRARLGSALQQECVPVHQAADMGGCRAHIGISPGIHGQRLRRLGKLAGSVLVVACERAADEQDSRVRLSRADIAEQRDPELFLQVTDIRVGITG